MLQNKQCLIDLLNGRLNGRMGFGLSRANSGQYQCGDENEVANTKSCHGTTPLRTTFWVGLPIFLPQAFLCPRWEFLEPFGTSQNLGTTLVGILSPALLFFLPTRQWWRSSPSRLVVGNRLQVNTGCLKTMGVCECVTSRC